MTDMTNEHKDLPAHHRAFIDMNGGYETHREGDDKEAHDAWVKSNTWGLTRDDFIRLSYFHGDFEQGSDGSSPINGSGDRPGDVVYQNPEKGCLTRSMVSHWLTDCGSFMHGYKKALKNNAALAARPEPAGAGVEPSYWLVESTQGCGWWDGRFLSRGIDPRFFSHDPNEAVRFSRKEDAERVAYQSSSLKATEHVWIDRAQSAPQAQQPVASESIKTEHEPACNLHFHATLNTVDDYCDCAEIRAFRAKRAAASEATEQDDELTTLSNELLALKHSYLQLELKLGATEHLLATLRATIASQESLIKHLTNAVEYHKKRAK